MNRLHRFLTNPMVIVAVGITLGLLIIWLSGGNYEQAARETPILYFQA